MLDQPKTSKESTIWGARFVTNLPIFVKFFETSLQPGEGYVNLSNSGF
jgi:hypothetical protein